MLTVNTDLGRTHVPTASDAEDADVAIATHLASRRDHPVVRGLGTMSEIGDQPPLLALSGTVLAFGMLTCNRRATEAGARMLGSLVLATWMKTCLKRLVARTRPNVLLQEGRYEVEPLGPDEGPWHSFPSGHTAGSVAVSRAAARIYPEARTAAYTAATAIALVQIPRGAHYPADVAAGAIVGLAAEAMVDRIAHRLLRDKSRPRRSSCHRSYQTQDRRIHRPS
jgi:membrane-associated phospholipid phosphatase